jgi:hypothetical protein
MPERADQGDKMDEPISINVKEITIEAIITRADGTVENLGVISRMTDGSIVMDEKKLQGEIEKVIADGNGTN